MIDSIRAQAKAVKDKQARLTMATQFEAMAKTLRDGVAADSTPAFFAENRAKKIAGRALSQRRMGAYYAEKAKQDEKALYGAGWRFMNDKDGTRTYGMKGKPGLQLRVSGNSFSIFQGDVVVQAKTELSLLKNYLTPLPPDKGPITNK